MDIKSDYKYNENKSFNIVLDDIEFQIEVKSGIVNEKYRSEYWYAKTYKPNYSKIIEAIYKKRDESFWDEGKEIDYIAGNSILDNLYKKLLTDTPEYKKASKNLDFFNFNNSFETAFLNIILSKKENKTQLTYGDNGYDESLGWYFEAEHQGDISSFPFFDLVEDKYNAEIKSYDGGNTEYYEKYKHDENRERLKNK